MKIPFNKPYLTGKETSYIEQAVRSGKISGDGIFTKKCHEFFEQRYGFRKVLLTNSCTDALEMAAILLDIKDGDEVIVPSYTFVSTANAFVLRGANIVFADSNDQNPNIDADSIEPLITSKTKAIVVVHYAGIACDMDKIKAIAEKHGLYVIEDAAQSIDSYYEGKVLGSIGDLATFSFHETKNVISGEGGMLAINNKSFAERAEIIREKGTNRSAFFRGEIDKYGWVDIGSSFLPPDIVAAFLYAQLENIENIQNRRKEIWQRYYTGLKELEENCLIKLPQIPHYATNNAHMFYILCGENERDDLIQHLKKKEILAVFHYLSLHKSRFYHDKHDGRVLPNADSYSENLLRLPFFYELEENDQHMIIREIKDFYS
ncbi:dTDP-4-amino-4,6-dideoxygalactose transaminase [Fulvivirgaceae bacterium BMA10]|uniref:dTDP-4-amino-4,6-dideoxygalactose transaminase n=1 Tax=Splendidivirga corallicola TaxID=3051826 RepID=A0ABT8KX94_9BACT|nr:dTDP-4-amino-4,6-dideoxygalactose transaminase [Fulvivirgaceae bacterium BMA10]